LATVISVIPPKQIGSIVTSTLSVGSAGSFTVTIALPFIIPGQTPASETATSVYVVVAVGVTGNVIELKKDGIEGDVVVPSEYWKDQGPVPVKFTVIFVDEPSQIAASPEIVAVGLWIMVIVNAVAGLAQPVDELIALTVPVYTPATALAGTVIAMGLTGNAVGDTSVKPWASATASKSIKY
jgi:hypothetical protein